ncbi:MAG: hypothetical protein PQJ46_06795, partial [Spirochaetales bacterium]|nr:hypothetical protein [Spirochaetales bacterium]
IDFYMGSLEMEDIYHLLLIGIIMLFSCSVPSFDLDTLEYYVKIGTISVDGLPRRILCHL